MKSQGMLATTLGLVVAFYGLPAVAQEQSASEGVVQLAQQRQAEDAGRYSLSIEQMDQVRGGRINLCEPDICVHHTPGPTSGAGCSQCPVIWNSGVDGPVIIWPR
ncbi:MAG TPA: hypothetical protein VFB54_05335 [Burkholderiales bacterium]|nr:hypothetical protein [Burkholderiales bacterium]